MNFSFLKCPFNKFDFVSDFVFSITKNKISKLIVVKIFIETLKSYFDYYKLIKRNF